MVLVFLNSQNGTKINNEETHITFDISPAGLQSPNRSFTIALKQMEFPMSFYNVDNTNNTLNLDGTIYTIPIQNYTALTLRDWITTNVVGIVATYDDNTNKFTLLKPTGSAFTISGSCYKLLGLTDSNGQTSSSVGGQQLLYPTNMVNMVYRPYLKCRITGTNNGSYNLRLGKVQFDAGRYEFVYYYDSNPEIVEINGFPTLTSITLRLADTDQNHYILNGVPWSAALEIIPVSSNA